MSKITAILGGAPSALERMRLQQASASAFAATLGTENLRTPAPVGPLADATCFAALSVKTQTPMIGKLQMPRSIGPDDFLASKRLAISRTTFDADWSRVKRQGLSRNEAVKLVGSGGRQVGQNLLASVNVWANRNIRYVEDRNQYGRGDHWASVRTTLKRRAGDCEDIAIAKMQLLTALGIPREAIYLTVARDLARNADHALLVVKLDGNHWILDNATDALLDGSASHDYRPIYSFGANGTWLHGYTTS